MALVKRRILATLGFDTVMKKLSAQEMKLVNSLSVLKLGKQYQEEHATMSQLYQKYIALGDEGKAQIEEFLDESVEMPALSSSILEEPKLELSAQDLHFLDAVIAK